MDIAGLPVQTVSDSARRFTGLFWGQAGCGKTTLACTAPGRKLLLNFDPNGPNAVAYRNDVDVVDFSVAGHKVLTGFNGDDPLKLSEKLSDDTYGTVILDSLTSLAQTALERGVDLAKGMANTGTPASIEFPGLQGYGARTTVSIIALKSLLRVTGRFNKHFISVTHEDDPTLSKKGEFMYITMLLGGKLKNNAALQISEIWFMTDKDQKRKIAVRPCRGYQPMKTRMFDAAKEPEFTWRYDASKPDEGQTHTIAHWWDAWNVNSKRKLAIPKD